MKLIEELRGIPPAVALQILLAHGVLLVASLHGGLPYIVLQGLLAFELVLLNLATVPLYPERGLLRHLFDLLKLSALLAFLLLFVCISYAIVSSGEHADPITTTLARWHGLHPASIAWAVGYIVVSLALSLLQALMSPEPRLAWMSNTLAAGGSTFVAMLFMLLRCVSRWCRGQGGRTRSRWACCTERPRRSWTAGTKNPAARGFQGALPIFLRRRHRRRDGAQERTRTSTVLPAST